MTAADAAPTLTEPATARSSAWPPVPGRNWPKGHPAVRSDWTARVVTRERIRKVGGARDGHFQLRAMQRAVAQVEARCAGQPKRCEPGFRRSSRAARRRADLEPGIHVANVGLAVLRCRREQGRAQCADGRHRTSTGRIPGIAKRQLPGAFDRRELQLMVAADDRHAEQQQRPAPPLRSQIPPWPGPGASRQHQVRIGRPAAHGGGNGSLRTRHGRESRLPVRVEEIRQFLAGDRRARPDGRTRPARPPAQRRHPNGRPATRAWALRLEPPWRHRP